MTRLGFFVPAIDAKHSYITNKCQNIHCKSRSRGYMNDCNWPTPAISDAEICTFCMAALWAGPEPTLTGWLSPLTTHWRHLRLFAPPVHFAGLCQLTSDTLSSIKLMTSRQPPSAMNEAWSLGLVNGRPTISPHNSLPNSRLNSSRS